ncbi:hypothetical protein KIW84_060205, partial [Lathyrus oleraceus]
HNIIHKDNKFSLVHNTHVDIITYSSPLYKTKLENTNIIEGKKMKQSDMFAQIGSLIASLMFIWAIFQQYFPYQLRNQLEKYSQKLATLIYPYIQITFHEFTGEQKLMRSEAYSSIENYLSTKASTQAKRLKGDIAKNNQSLVLSMDDHEEVSDEFNGVKLWWASGKNVSKPNSFSLHHNIDEKSKAGEFYGRIGRAWKRGYLLYGPPGTGKSTMIAAMANLLGYDLYDLELTAVKDNTELRKLLIETSSKSIIVIEDIDCSLDLTGQRTKKKAKKDDEEERKSGVMMEEREGRMSQVTLSGLLNFIDGLWSACGGERLIVFTTNYVEKLDPALVRKGRMDKHIELSYCGFEAFKILAKNYLNIESHYLFDTICELLEEVEITPADVAEHLMPKSSSGDVQVYLKSLIHALQLAKEGAKVKSMEDAKKL